jgi:cephalosporin-C deacetylase-like acetyl esterase
MTTTTKNSGLGFEDRVVTSMLPPRTDETVAPGLVIFAGYWERMNEEYEQFSKKAA